MYFQEKGIREISYETKNIIEQIQWLLGNPEKKGNWHCFFFERNQNGKTTYLSSLIRRIKFCSVNQGSAVVTRTWTVDGRSLAYLDTNL